MAVCCRQEYYGNCGIARILSLVSPMWKNFSRQIRFCHLSYIFKFSIFECLIVKKIVKRDSKAIT